MPMGLFPCRVTPRAGVRLLLVNSREVHSKEGIAGRGLEENRGFMLGDLLKCFSYTLLLLGSV
jgi:hypothetical protein